MWVNPGGSPVILFHLTFLSEMYSVINIQRLKTYANEFTPFNICFFLASMKGYMHLSEPMKRYETTLDSHGSNLKNRQKKIFKRISRFRLLWVGRDAVLTLCRGQASRWYVECTLGVGRWGWRSWPAPRSTEAREGAGRAPFPLCWSKQNFIGWNHTE